MMLSVARENPAHGPPDRRRFDITATGQAVNRKRNECRLAVPVVCERRRKRPGCVRFVLTSYGTST